MANPYWRFGLLSLGTAALMTVFLSFWIHPILTWLVVINIIAWVTYRYDKAIAGSGTMRVPERVLFLLEAVGGTIGAAIGIWFSRHKSKSGSFLLRFFLIAILQLVSIIAIYFVAA